MVRYKLKEKEHKKDKEPELTVFVQENDLAQGGAELCVVDEGGNEWIVATLLSNGVLEVCEGMPDDIGLKVDKEGCVVVCTTLDDTEQHLSDQ